MFDQLHSCFCDALNLIVMSCFFGKTQRLFGLFKPNSAPKNVVTIPVSQRFSECTQESL